MVKRGVGFMAQILSWLGKEVEWVVRSESDPSPPAPLPQGERGASANWGEASVLWGAVRKASELGCGASAFWKSVRGAGFAMEADV